MGFTILDQPPPYRNQNIPHNQYDDEDEVEEDC